MSTDPGPAPDLSVGDVLRDGASTVSVPCPVGYGHMLDAPTMATVVGLPGPGEALTAQHLRVEIDTERLHAVIDEHVEANYRTHVVDRVLGASS